MNASPTAATLYDTRSIAYLDLSGGLNTLKAPHALARSELATLVNAWYAYGTALSKRPGSQTVAGGATGGGNAGTSLVTARFDDATYLVVQQGADVYAAPVTGTEWTKIGSVSASGIMRGAQMYDETSSKDTLFIVDGVSTPQMWQGPTTTLVDVTTGSGYLPNKPNSSNPITPAFVSTLGNNSHLFYAGDPDAPCAVYISDAFSPETFTTPAMNADPYGYTGSGGTFLPAIIGFNDGVDGGNVTGLQTLGFAMVVFKEAAIYAMTQTQLLGNVAWQVYCVSAQRGALSPRSIVAFAGYAVFLAIDGVYMTFGQPNEDLSRQKISANVPSFFDSTRFGGPALIQNRATAIAVRHSNRYIVWFDSGTGKPTTGVWFDFDVPAANNMPAAGQITGMTMGGAAALCGPQDSGNVAWCDASQDRVGVFGLGFADFDAPIAVQIAGKADLFEDLFGPQAALMNKVPARCDLIVATLSQGTLQTLTFTGAYNTNFSLALPPAIPLPPVSVPEQAGEWGDNWGAFNWSSAALGESGYYVLTLRPQRTSVGYILQMAIAESSIYPWLLLGFVLELNAREVSR